MSEDVRETAGAAEASADSGLDSVLGSRLDPESDPGPDSDCGPDSGPDSGLDAELVRSGRDAAATRRALVRAALRRFATDGYRATTVRRIAADAGVNVALINRYFDSKEGLFEACMVRTSKELDTEGSAGAPDLGGDASAGTGKLPADEGPLNLDRLIRRLIAHVVNAPDGDDPLQMLLLLRSSGDDNADRIRRNALERVTQKLAAAAGWRADDASTAPILLRAQIAVATMLGMVMLRASAAVEPIASVGAEELAEPLGQVFHDLLAKVPRGTPGPD